MSTGAHPSYRHEPASSNTWVTLLNGASITPLVRSWTIGCRHATQKLRQTRRANEVWFCNRVSEAELHLAAVNNRAQLRRPIVQDQYREGTLTRFRYFRELLQHGSGPENIYERPAYERETDVERDLRLRRDDVRPHSSLGYLTPAAFKAKDLADVDA